MQWNKVVPHWLTPERVRPALIMGVTLFFVSYLFDLGLAWLGISGEMTILNNLVIAVFGALLLIFYLSTLHFEQNFLRARERATLIVELNHHVRNALTVINYSAELDDRNERLRRISESVERIDRVLTDLVPTVGSARAPRFFFPEQT